MSDHRKILLTVSIEIRLKPVDYTWIFFYIHLKKDFSKNFQ